ncbi:MAG: UDP-N-acetylmuramoyl-L-alanine--D-glutamate ligase [Oscillospiraceae bacterium]|nr:UDP-N-acetylmuramoyl-L-alanine--D-glutamate ligase [Oscillospiraceae bacterium]
MDINSYFSSLAGKSVAVLGLGVSNLPLARRLIECGARVTIRDKNENPVGAEEFRAAGAKLVLGENYLENIDEEVIFRSPGIRPDVPGIAAAVQRGAELTSEMEAFFVVCPCPVIAVTGSDGKTTTSTLISEFLKAAGRTVHLGGNIGTPLLCKAGDMREDDFAVVELSSFQLMTMKQSPHIAVITNITPNHLDWHTGMEEYTAAKINVFAHQRAGDILVLNADDSASCNLGKKAAGELRFFSAKERPEKGVWYKDGVIYRGDEKVVETLKIKIPGFHNVYNFMTAYCAVCDYVTAEQAAEVAESFGGVEHRLEFVREKDGVRFVNDSIASSPTRTAAALSCYGKELVLIAGGKDKGVPFDSLAPIIAEKVNLLVLTGFAAENIKNAVKDWPGCPEIIMEPDFKTAVIAAAKGAKSGETVLLSPACTSFDHFKNFDQRGKYFKEIVNEL